MRLTFLMILLGAFTCSAQQIDFSHCNTLDSYQGRKACAEVAIYEALITYLDEHTTSVEFEGISSFLAEMKLFHKYDEKVYLIFLLCDEPKIYPLIQDFFAMQEPVSRIVNIIGQETELEWRERLEFKRSKGGFTAETSNKTIVYYTTFPKHPDCKQNSNKKAAKCFSKKVDNLIKKELTKDFIQSLNLAPGIKKISAQFAVTREGDVSNVRVRAPHPDLERRVVSILKRLPKMKPATKYDLPVEVQFAFPVFFDVVN